MAEYIIKSRAVFDGRADSCKPLAVWIKGDRIKKLLPYDETNAVPADVPIYDMGDKLVMPSFIDAHTHIFTGAVAASEYVCNILDVCHSEQECGADGGICKGASRTETNPRNWMVYRELDGGSYAGQAKSGCIFLGYSGISGMCGCTQHG